MSKHQTIYQEEANAYQELISREDYQGLLLPALEAICDFRGKDIVEFGAGTGRLTCMLAPMAKSIKAFDAAGPMLGVAEVQLKALGIQDFSLKVADNENIPLPDQCADITIEGWSFGHLVGWNLDNWQLSVQRAMNEFLRILRPGGTAIIIETLGTGETEPKIPREWLGEFYGLLENEYGFTRSWCRTDYQFTSVEEADRLVRFFFGDELADRIVEEKLTILPECTGIWSYTKGSTNTN